MNNKPGQDSPPEVGENLGETAKPQPTLISKWLEQLTHLGLGELSLRIGTNLVVVLMVVVVVWLLQHGNLGSVSQNIAASDRTPISTQPAIQLPAELAYSPVGIARQAEIHTIIPSRPRMDVIPYTVQPGDSIFKIADNFGLKPTTILFGNYDKLKDSPDLLKAGQILNILPVDGTYYYWLGTENLSVVATTFGVDAQAIIEYPGNHLDPDTIGDLGHPNIAAGTWLIVPGGSRPFTSWTAPAQLVRSNPSVHVWGPGVCTGIKYVQVGYGSFIYPTTEHWLSGTPFTPSIRHFGVDFAGAEGNAVYAVDAGTVVYSGWNTWGYGWLVIIDHGNGWQSLYAHLSQINAGCGLNVGQGDLIGLVGMTGGTSTGPHLHFELMNTVMGYVNPLDYITGP
jgi:hypothetical protein